MLVPTSTMGSRSPVCMMSRTCFSMRSELAAWMEHPEMLGREPAALQERHRQGIAEGELHRGRGGGSKPVRAGFLGPRER